MPPFITANYKVLHFVAGAVISAALYPLLGYYSILVAVVAGSIMFDMLFPDLCPKICHVMVTALGGLLVALFIGLRHYL